MSERTDEELIAAIATGDQPAFDTLYARHEFGVRAYLARNYRQENVEIDDLCQRVWMRVWQHAGKHKREESKVFTWITNIARNEIRRELKKSDNVERAESDYTQDTLNSNPTLVDTAPAVLDTLIEQEERDIQLTKLQAAAMLCGPNSVKAIDGIISGLTQREVAKVLGIGKTRADQLIQRVKETAKNLPEAGQMSVCGV
jgi:RNA polymerase sigma factor (sigma-70 family)